MVDLGLFALFVIFRNQGVIMQEFAQAGQISPNFEYFFSVYEFIFAVGLIGAIYLILGLKNE